MVGPVSTVGGISGKDVTLVVSSRLGSLGQASCFSGLPLGSLNYLYAKCGKLHDVDSPLRSVRNPHTQNIYALAFDSNSWPVSSAGTALLCSLVQVEHSRLDQDLVRASRVLL